MQHLEAILQDTSLHLDICVIVCEFSWEFDGARHQVRLEYFPVDSTSAYSIEARCFNRCFTAISRAVHECRAVHNIVACGRNSSPPICLPLNEMKRVSHHACTNTLMRVRKDMEKQTNIIMLMTLMNNGTTENEYEIRPLTVTCT